MRRFGLVVFLLLTVGPAVDACSVPVFRYALENWNPSPYELIVFHRGELSTVDRTTLDSIRNRIGNANVRIVEVDVDGELTAVQKKLLEGEGSAKLPRAVLRFPEAGEMVPAAWSGPLALDAIRPLFESPARTALFQKLTAGHAGAILLLLSGDAALDRAAREFLAKEVPGIAARIEVPKPTADGPQVKSDRPLKIEFPVIEVARTPAEDGLVRQLLGSEDGLRDEKGPIAFPVFGRGRALCNLHGKDLGKIGELQRSLEFLCRACSCQVKELNPGLDLLIDGRWDVIFEPSSAPNKAEPRPTGSSPEVPELRSAPPAGYETSEVTGEAPSRSPWVRYAMVGAGLAVLFTGAWVLRSRRPRNG